MNILKLSSKFSPTQRMIIDSVKAFSQKDLQPYVRKNFREEKTEKKIFKQMGNLGIFGPTLSSFGCLGDSYLTYGLIAKEIESVDSGYRSMYSVQSSLVMNPISQYGTTEIQETYLPRLFSGDYVGCFGLTEPNAGSDPSSMVTTASEDSNGNYVLNGTKTWISNAPIADVLIIWAKMNGRINGFVLDRTMDGIITPKIEGKLSLRTFSPQKKHAINKKYTIYTIYYILINLKDFDVSSFETFTIFTGALHRQHIALVPNTRFK